MEREGMTVEVKSQKGIPTNVEEKLRSKLLYKIELYLIKVIPMIISGIYVLNTILSYFDIDVPALSYIGGVSLLPLAFLYLSSYVFKFCLYHRMFLHYVLLVNILDIYDYYIGIPITNKAYLILIISITAIFIFFITYFKFKKI